MLAAVPLLTSILSSSLLHVALLAVTALALVLGVAWYVFCQWLHPERLLVDLPCVDKAAMQKAAGVEKTEDKILVVGAGLGGLGCAAALVRRGIPFDIVDGNEDIGGNWLNGVYDNVHIISSRVTTEYKDFPMPAHYPEFPSKQQMHSYLKSYAAHWGILPKVQLNTQVRKIVPDDEQGNSYTVTVEKEGGEPQKHTYKGVYVCTGHHRNRRWPKLNGTFTGELIHSKDYKSPEQLKGKRVLVLGAGNSACDVNADAAQAAEEAHASLRRGHWFMPRVVGGKPVIEYNPPWWPHWLTKFMVKRALRVCVGDYRLYGLPVPDHDIYELHPTINSSFLHYLKLGKIKPHPGIQSVDGKEVTFVDGQTITVDLIVCATGYHNNFPMCEPTLTYTEQGTPNVIEGAVVPGKKNYFVFGTQQPRYGAGPLVTQGAELMAEFVRVQPQCKRPVGDILLKLGAVEMAHTPNKLTPDLLLDPYPYYRKLAIGTAIMPMVPRFERIMETLRLI
ncbi:unnamed protein product [Vitrella brassicaformis CCMP3155]|uniref:Flavin-containing monooxygenase n=1 Tax=Vitrella brassicaformis (strain CCMP3155) TaxID=1169540 RepID=A0A0G4EBS8_VITBC|nr:unnamed protein product [Vitrella brassicaformis CCMP3155]|eukprot:CEL92752.1 unnamed protein product [Vitrella brassicaformis CCMP3155]